ncbi:hypothetical protein VZT92_025461 [Zoarces viviparus]|uniref:Uncharacterized protein n=1 Tax=Zoarces viviparus TaxID=48416 RepID=A0AAW1DXB8_ZOAVI
MRKVRDVLNERKLKVEDGGGGQTDGGPVVKATAPPPDSPHVGSTLAPPRSLCRSPTRFTFAQRGTAASYRLAAVFWGAVLSLALMFLTLHPREGPQGSHPRHRDPTPDLNLSSVATLMLKQ